jgi:hypothetical protein
MSYGSSQRISEEGFLRLCSSSPYFSPVCIALQWLAVSHPVIRLLTAAARVQIIQIIVWDFLWTKCQ